MLGGCALSRAVGLNGGLLEHALQRRPLLVGQRSRLKVLWPRVNCSCRLGQRTHLVNSVVTNTYLASSSHALLRRLTCAGQAVPTCPSAPPSKPPRYATSTPPSQLATWTDQRRHSANCPAGVKPRWPCPHRPVPNSSKTTHTIQSTQTRIRPSSISPPSLPWPPTPAHAMPTHPRDAVRQHPPLAPTPCTR